MKRILGVHGIYNFSWSKDSFTDRMLDALAHHGYETVDVPGHFMTAFMAYSDWAVNRRAQAILELHQPGDAVIAHSFGCLATHAAMRKGARFSTVIFFGAAVECTVRFPKNGFERLYNVHSRDDRALAIGKVLKSHPFGGLGMEGYAGKDARIVNVPAHGLGHNDHVKPRELCRWAGWAHSVLSPKKRQRRRAA